MIIINFLLQIIASIENGKIKKKQIKNRQTDKQNFSSIYK